MKNDRGKTWMGMAQSGTERLYFGAIAGILKKDGEWTPTEGEQKSPEQLHSPSLAARQSHTAQT
jgi:hypothetical protein